MTRPIMAGVDGSVFALHAVRWAAAEARRRHAPLRLVQVCTLVSPGYTESVYLPEHLDAQLRQGRQWLKEAADAAAAWTPLIVVGDHDRGALTGLSSVSHRPLHHAECPLAVIRRNTSPT